jgi:hypothetical protein
MNRKPKLVSPTRHAFRCGTIAGCIVLTLASLAGAVVVSDNFNTAHDYQFGVLPGGGIWNGMENVLNLSGGAFNASMTNAGTLTVEDNGTFDADGNPDNGISGMGWEGGRSTAPFLRRDVPAGQDFTATVKIAAQTSGQWSAAGIIARAANSATPPGIGPDHADENFVTNYSFRTDAANVNQGTTLNKRIEAGAQLADINIQVNADPANEPLPVVLKLQRFGSTGYVSSVSTDGGTTFQFQSMTIPAAGNALRDPAVGMQVGLGYMNFGTLAGTVQFDDFTLDTHNPLPAPGVPTLTAPQNSITVGKGGVALLSVTNTAANQGALFWDRTPNLPGTDAMILSQGGPPSTLTPPPPANGSYFRWAVPATQANGSYTVNVTAMNAWGQLSQPLTLTVVVIPEPLSIALAGLAMAAFAGLMRRRR